MDNRTIEEIRKNETLLIEEIKGLIEENQELKKQIEEYNLATENFAYWKGKNESKMKINRLRMENRDLKAQKIEFINWLEMTIQDGRSKDDLWLMGYYDACKDMLEKIIGKI